VLCVIQFIALVGTMITFSSFQQIAASRGVCPARLRAVIETVIYRGINTHYILRMPTAPR
jgi:hypothetical protein